MEKIDEPQTFSLPGIGIPAEVLFHPELTFCEKVLFGFLRNLSQTEKGCWASNQWLGGLIGVGRRTISNGIAKLKKLQYISVQTETASDGGTTRRIFINPAFPQRYRALVVQRHKEIEASYPSVIKFLGDSKNFPNPRKFFATKDVKEKDKENIYMSNSVNHTQKKPDPFADKIREVYMFYCETFSKNPSRYKLTQAKRRKIKARLKDSTIEEIKNAILACKSSAYHNGQNESGMLYNDLLRNIITTREKVEWWNERYKKPKYAM